MKPNLIAILLLFAITAPTASAATIRSAPAPVAPASAPPIRTAPTAATPITPAPATPTRIAPAETNHWNLYAGAQLGDSVVGGLLGITINNMYSLEARYDYVDPIYQPNNTLKSHSAGIAGIAMFPLRLNNMEPFFIFAKAGYERTTDESTTTDPGLPGIFPPTTTVATTTRNRVTVGGGAQYDFSKNVSGRIGVNFIGSDHSAYLAALYKF